jgi:hypothetical protein
VSHPTGLISRSFVPEFCAWRDCETLADHPDHPLCERHFRKVGMLFIHENIDVMRAAAGGLSTTDLLERLVGEEPEGRRVAREQAWAAERAERRAAGVVYYVRMGELIKIGTTTHLARRMQELYAAEHGALLATEPGGQSLEAERHRQFADERQHRELFNPSDRLLAHIDHLAELM